MSVTVTGYRFEPVTSCVMCGSNDSKVRGRRLSRHQGLRPRQVVGVATTVVQCRSCGLVYANPRVVPESLAQHYDLDPRDYWRETQLDHNGADPGLPLASFRRHWSGRDPRALEIGAGLGQAMMALAAKGFDTYGLEPSPAFRDEAIRRGVDPERLQLAAVEDAKYEPGAFDLISFCAVLEHLINPAAAIENAMRWLAPGGLLFAEVPSARWLLGRLLNLTYRLQGLDYVTNLSPMHPPYPCTSSRWIHSSNTARARAMTSSSTSSLLARRSCPTFSTRSRSGS